MAVIELSDDVRRIPLGWLLRKINKKWCHTYTAFTTPNGKTYTIEKLFDKGIVIKKHRDLLEATTKNRHNPKLIRKSDDQTTKNIKEIRKYAKKQQKYGALTQNCTHLTQKMWKYLTE